MSTLARSMALPLALSACLAGVAMPALAQRTDENVTAQSEDAFGRSVGNERIGIYTSGDVRGFSPVDAGNVRMGGLYFDQQKDPTSRLVAGSAIRVGIAAQSYPFPSPTGIVDYELRRVGKQRVLSTVLSYGPFGSAGVEVDGQFPMDGERFGIAAGAGVFQDEFEYGGDSVNASYALIPLWRPTANIEVQPFVSGIIFRDEEPTPLLLTPGSVVPPKVRRRTYYGQPWAQAEGEILNYGVIGQARFSAWTTSLGIFESVFSPDAEYAELFTDVQPSGVARELVVAFPASRYASTSGELRVARAFVQQDRRHTLLFSLRARDQQRRYGGEDVVDLGTVQLGVGRPVPEPSFAFGPQSTDDISQQTVGAAYELRLKDRGELSVGVQQTAYEKRTRTPAGALPASEDEPLLGYASGTVHLTPRLALYGSYTEGLEESPVAPSNAVNRNVAAPALSTEQYDAGVRIALPAALKLIAGVFNVEKPYFDLDAAGFFTQLGIVQHRGGELSLAGTPLENLTVVAGARYLDATVSGSIVDAGLIGARPVASAKTYAMASVDYALAGTPFSFDVMAEVISSQVADPASSLQVPGREVLHLGGRYRFTLFGKPATLRAQAFNVFDRYGWIVSSGGAYVYNAPRRLTVYLAADL